MEEIRRHGMGRLVTPWSWRSPVQDVPWCFDNGAFRAFTQGIAWDEDRFLRYAVYDEEIGMPRLLHQSYAVRGPDFGVCPDIVCGGAASLRFSLAWMMRLPSCVPWYLAVQDGMTPDEVDAALDEAAEEAFPFRGLFVGGSLAWKWRSTPSWVRFCRERGLRCHVGRVSGKRRLAWCELVGVDSVDSSAFERFVPAKRVSDARAAAAAQTRLWSCDADGPSGVRGGCMSTWFDAFLRETLYRGRSLAEVLAPPTPEREALEGQLRGENVVLDTADLPVLRTDGGRVFRRRRRPEFVGLDPRRVQSPKCWFPRVREWSLDFYSEEDTMKEDETEESEPVRAWACKPIDHADLEERERTGRCREPAALAWAVEGRAVLAKWVCDTHLARTTWTRERPALPDAAPVEGKTDDGEAGASTEAARPSVSKPRPEVRLDDF